MPQGARSRSEPITAVVIITRTESWNSGNKFYVYNHGGGIENVGLIETNTAVYYETCENNSSYTGTITNVGQSSPDFHHHPAGYPDFF